MIDKIYDMEIDEKGGHHSWQSSNSALSDAQGDLSLKSNDVLDFLRGSEDGKI
jgi:hypothetical protein